LAGENAAVQAAMQQRRKLRHTEMGTHARMADAAQYTDDPLLVSSRVR
jgi:hypothetical protein